MPTDTRVFLFADFRVDTAERVLYRREIPVRLAPKAFDILLALVSRSGRVVSKDTLMEEIWENTFVEENNLTQHIFTLRRTLGETKGGTKFIETVSRRGYRFLPDVSILNPVEVTIDPSNEEFADERFKTSSRSGDGTTHASEFESEPANDNTNGFHPRSSSNGTGTVNGFDPAPEATGTIARNGRKPAGRSILVLGLALVAFAGTLGFALRSGWQSPSSRDMSLVRLTESGNLWGASISPDGKSLAYVVRDGTTYSLRLKNIQSESEVVILPPADVRLGNPRFSPDGSLIYFFRGNDAFQMPIFGGESRKIASNLWSNFSISPDGQQIAFPRAATPGGSSSIVVADTDGGVDRVVATKTAPDFYFSWGPAPVFSPSGKHLTAVTGRHGSDEVRIVEIDHESGDERDLKMEAAWEAVEYVDWRTQSELLVAGKKKGDETTQIWSVQFPDGSVERVTNDLNNYLSFTLSADKNEIVAIQESENLHLWRFDSDTGAVHQITSGVSRSEGRYGLAFAPDGQIVFTARDKNNFDIYSVSSDGGEVHQLTKNAGKNSDPVVSADNQFIAFVSDRTGRQRLWLMNRSGDGLRRLTTVSDEDDIDEIAPYFSPDERLIYYVSQRAGQSHIRKISIDGGESQPVEAGGESADKPVPSPDGKYLAHAVYNSGAASPWQVAVKPLSGETATERYFDFPAFRLRVRWTLDSGSLLSVDDRTGGYNLWLTSLTSGERHAITNFKAEKIYRFDVSQDRRSYVLARGDYFYDAVLIRP